MREAMSVNGNISAGGEIRGTVSGTGAVHGSVSGPAPIHGSTGGMKVLHTDSYAIAVANGFVGTVDEWLESLKGPKGDTGISPVVAVEDIDGGHRVTITDKNGAKQFDVMDGTVTEEQIASAVEDYMAEHPVEVTDIVKTVNGQTPDENGNVEIAGKDVDLSGYATEKYVQEYAQPKGAYLTEVPSGYATEEFVKNKIAEAELSGEEVDLSGYAQKSELPTKVSQLQNDSGYLTAVPDGYAKTEDIPKNASDIGAQPEGDYALRSEIPSVPVKSVNGKTGTVSLTATDVKARPDSWMPSASDVGALPSSTVIPTVPTKLSAFTNDSGFITGYTETDPTVPSWAKQANKPSYTASEVGALPNTTKIPSKTSDLTNDSGYITGYTETDPTVPAWAKAASKPSYSKSEVGLGNVDNVKQYSASNPPPYPVTSVNGKTGAVTITVPTVPTKVSAFENDKGYLTQHQDISGKLDTSALPTAINTALEQAKASGEFDGEDGYTPVKGKDYYTEADKAEFSQYIASELAKRGQLAPEYANSIDECTDTSKMYVLPDGYIYAYMLTEVEVEGGAGYTNLLPTATDTDGTILNGVGYLDGYRLSSSGSTAVYSTVDASGFIPAKKGDVIRIKNFSAPKGVSCYVITYNGTTKVAHKAWVATITDAGVWPSQTSDWFTVEGEKTPSGVTTFTLDSDIFGTGFTAFRFSGTIDGNTIVTVNEEIVEGGGTTTVTEYAWVNTGHAFVPADYEDRIIALEEQVVENTADIATLKRGAVDTGGVDALTWIRNWDSPIYDRVPTFQLSTENPAVTSAEKTVASIYAKYDALVEANPNYITKTDLGVCSDGVTHVYRYDFCEPEPHHQSGQQWSETKPVIICASGIHWEWAGVYSLYYALKEITENAELDDLRRNVHFVVVPIINPYCFTDIGAYSETYGVLNANGVQIHRNFEVGFIYPGESGYSEFGTRNHGGTEPLSEIETQNIDNIFKEFPDAALFMTCHSAQRDTRWGTGFIWASTATNYTCNLGYRLVDKMSKAWHKKYGTTWEEGCVRENEYVLADPDTYPNAVALAEGDYRAGHAHVSSTDGTETRQATKYGIQGANVEVLEAFWVLSDTVLDGKVTTHGAEVYINYLLMYMGCYDHKDKKQYYVG